MGEFLQGFLSGKGTYLVGASSIVLGAWEYYANGNAETARQMWVLGAGLLGLRRAQANGN